jgi:hypothetical protein
MGSSEIPSSERGGGQQPQFDRSGLPITEGSKGFDVRDRWPVERGPDPRIPQPSQSDERPKH